MDFKYGEENVNTDIDFRCRVDGRKNIYCFPTEKIICCIRCNFLSECYKAWKKGNHYCKRYKKPRWCSGIRNFIEKNGLNRLKEWRIA